MDILIYLPNLTIAFNLLDKVRLEFLLVFFCFQLLQVCCDNDGDHNWNAHKMINLKSSIHSISPIIIAVMISIVLDNYFVTANNNTYLSSKCYHWEQQTMQILVEYNCIPQKKYTNAYFQGKYRGWYTICTECLHSYTNQLPLNTWRKESNEGLSYPYWPTVTYSDRQWP